MKTAALESTCHTSVQILTAGRRRYRGRHRASLTTRLQRSATRAARGFRQLGSGVLLFPDVTAYATFLVIALLTTWTA